MALAVLSAAPAAAQGDAGAVISASVGASAIESRTEWTVWGTAGYRFNRYTGLEIEVTSVPTSKAPFPSDSLSGRAPSDRKEPLPRQRSSPTAIPHSCRESGRPQARWTDHKSQSHITP